MGGRSVTGALFGDKGKREALALLGSQTWKFGSRFQCTSRASATSHIFIKSSMQGVRTDRNTQALSHFSVEFNLCLLPHLWNFTHSSMELPAAPSPSDASPTFSFRNHLHGMGHTLSPASPKQDQNLQGDGKTSMKSPGYQDMDTILHEFSSWKEWSGIETAQGGLECPSLEESQECLDMALTALVGVRLDSVILEIFSILDRSGICDPGNTSIPHTSHWSHASLIPPVSCSPSLTKRFGDPGMLS